MTNIIPQSKRLPQLEGKRITWFIIDFALTLELGTLEKLLEYSIRIDGDFTCTVKGKTHNLSVDTWENIGVVFGLIQAEVKEASYQNKGVLLLTFEDDARIEVTPSLQYESWQIARRNNDTDDNAYFLMVCTPGGDIAIWDSKTLNRNDKSDE